MNDHPELLERAIRIAVREHAGQTRKGDGQPYITHPIAVALLVARAGLSVETVAVALLHDVVEDTAMTPEEMAREVGSEVTRAVLAVTKDETLRREERERRYEAGLRRAGREALAVAVADKIHNLFAMMRAVDQEGPGVLRRFSGSPEGRIAHYERCRDIVRERWPDCPLLPELDRQLELARERRLERGSAGSAAEP